MLRKAVIPAAGLGTRLLSVTKEQPKEMAAGFREGEEWGLVFEAYCSAGLRAIAVDALFFSLGFSSMKLFRKELFCVARINCYSDPVPGNGFGNGKWYQWMKHESLVWYQPRLGWYRSREIVSLLYSSKA